MKRSENYLSTQKNKTNQSLDLINLGKKRNHWERMKISPTQRGQNKALWSPNKTLKIGFNWYINAAQADVNALYGD